MQIQIRRYLNSIGLEPIRTITKIGGDILWQLFLGVKKVQASIIKMATAKKKLERCYLRLVLRGWNVYSFSGAEIEIS